MLTSKLQIWQTRCGAGRVTDSPAQTKMRPQRRKETKEDAKKIVFGHGNNLQDWTAWQPRFSITGSFG
jgi:hypothetical protein